MASRLAAQYADATLSVLSECREHCLTIPPTLGVFVDVDPGMHRTGVAANDPATVGEIAAAAGDRFRGLHFYDGHIHLGVGLD